MSSIIRIESRKNYARSLIIENRALEIDTLSKDRYFTGHYDMNHGYHSNVTSCHFHHHFQKTCRKTIKHLIVMLGAEMDLNRTIRYVF